MDDGVRILIVEADAANRKAYRDIYPNARCIDIVAARYRDDLERFGYEFD